MAANNSITDQIRTLALVILESTPEGLRFSDLRSKILDHNPGFNANTINGSIWNLDATFAEKVYKPDKGIFRLMKFKEDILTQPEEKPFITTSTTTTKKKTIREEDFYKPFADWIVNELEECTKAIALGGNIFKDKWGTPDVIGIRESKRSDIIQFPTEIISVEIKTDSIGLITAFGQACAYKIFSHKSYIVVPVDSQIEDLSRLDTLSRQFGIGLILFDNQNPEDPKFEIRARAAKHEPDMFFLNKNLKFIEDKLFKY